MDNYSTSKLIADLQTLGLNTSAIDLDSELNGEIEILVGKAALSRMELEKALSLFKSAKRHLSETQNKAHLANQLLLLARAWNKERDSPDGKSRAEEAMREAVALDPVRALPALALHVQRQKRLPEALDLWHEAIRVDPNEANHYLSLARTYEQSGQVDRAVNAYLELISVDPSPRNYLVVAQRLEELTPSLPMPAPNSTIKIALLGNATLDRLQSYVRVECHRAGFRPHLYQGGFDQYTQDILNPHSELYAFAPEVVVLAIHASRLFPGIHQYPFDMTSEERTVEIDVGLSTVQQLLDAITERSSALVLVHNMVAPQFPALGILDWRDELGQAEMFGHINSRLAALVRSQYKNVYIVDEEKIQARTGKANATDPRLWLTARMGWSDQLLTGIAREYLRYLKPYKAQSRKCIVLDLDNTLWGGVIGEDGVSGIQLGPDAPGNSFVLFQRELERLWHRGILLAICSKNNPEDVFPVFEQHPSMILKLSHFAAHRINWESKAQNIRDLAKELNIGLDSIVFLDDNPVERARMRAEVPQVLTPEIPTDAAYYRYALLDLDAFETLAFTEEDRRRNQLYVEQKARREFDTGQTTSGSLDDYLAALEMVVDIDAATAVTLPRIAQLTNKTNQFNLTTRRYSEAQIAEMQSLGYLVYSVRVADRFGDNGLVGVAIIARKDDWSWNLDTLLLSCRVMGRSIETAFLAFLIDRARESGVRSLEGWYLPTAKNSPVRDLYRQHGFHSVDRRSDGSELWQLEPASAEIAVPGWLTIRSRPALV